MEARNQPTTPRKAPVPTPPRKVLVPTSPQKAPVYTPPKRLPVSNPQKSAVTPPRQAPIQQSRNTTPRKAPATTPRKQPPNSIHRQFPNNHESLSDFLPRIFPLPPRQFFPPPRPLPQRPRSRKQPPDTQEKPSIEKPHEDQNRVLASIEVGEPAAGVSVSPPPGSFKSSDTHGVAKLIRATSPRHYIISPELDGIRRALGESDWEAYIRLLQQLLACEITQESFDAISAHTFLMPTMKMRRQVQRKVSEMIVSAALEDCEGGDGAVST